jgi:hypothetical protein
MDARLKYHKHIARAAAKGLEASLEPRRLRGLSPTVATWVAEAEAHIPSAQERFWKRAVKLWTDIHALPETNLLRRNTLRMRKFRRQYRSLLF